MALCAAAWQGGLSFLAPRVGPLRGEPLPGSRDLDVLLTGAKGHSGLGSAGVGQAFGFCFFPVTSELE